MIKRYTKFLAWGTGIIIAPYLVDAYVTKHFGQSLNWLLLWQCAMICLVYTEDECLRQKKQEKKK